MKTIIVEDEQLAAKRLKNMVNQIDQDIIVDGVFDGVFEAQHYLNSHRAPEIIFLDIHLSDGNAFDLLERIDIQSNIIFTTAHDDYIQHAFERQAFDYLLKPIRIQELKESIKRIKNGNSLAKKNISALNFDENSSYLLKNGAKYHMVKLTDISYIYQIRGMNILVCVNGKVIPVNIGMEKIYNQLNHQTYCYLSSKLILHINAIKELITDTPNKKTRIKLNPECAEAIMLNPSEIKKLQLWLQL